MKTIDFDYQLPRELIAQFPAKQRDQSRLMVLDRSNRRIQHTAFSRIVDYLEPSDALVINQTKVFPARLFGQKRDTKVPVEIMLLRQLTSNSWEALIRPGRKGRTGDFVSFKGNGVCCKIAEELPLGKKRVEFDFEGDFSGVLERVGEVPLPPYIRRKPRKEDKERYQTVYAKDQGAVAAPTAGLHFTLESLEKIRKLGARVIPITLHVGWDSFRPIREEDFRQHQLESEYYQIQPSSAEAINQVKNAGGRIVAVGTTTTRCLESVSDSNGRVSAQTGWTDRFIYPPYEFKLVDSLVTNFHLPKSTLLLLVSAFAGRDFILEAYREAIEKEYRFYSYGDAMFIY